MFAKTMKWLFFGLFAAGLAVGARFMLAPQPVPVDIATIARGGIETTIDEEGKSRVKDIYRISAPITGKLERLAAEVGDAVAKGERLARIRPVDPPIRDMRTRRELVAATKIAMAGVQLALAEVAKARSDRGFSLADLERAERLAVTRTISDRALQQAKLAVEMKNAQLAEAEANLEFRRREQESAQARQLLPTQLSLSQVEDQCCIALVAPVEGTVLKLLTESEQVVQAGTPLLDIGNLADQEIVVDILSSDAVKIVPGTIARIEDWGGEGMLNARVRRKSPAGFTKVSALGIEEQRVKLVLDITDPRDKWSNLGHGFRVNVKIIASQTENALRVPLGALFRKGNDWAVYVLKEGKAVQTVLQLGQFSLSYAEVTGGLDEGTKVIVYPSDRISDGVLVADRKSIE